jgi:hypothetical protein
MTVEIGGTALEFRAPDPAFQDLVASRYAGFLTNGSSDPLRFTVELSAPPPDPDSGDLIVRRQNGLWSFERSDFTAVFDPAARAGKVRQSPNPWSLDAFIRVVHSLELARAGGFLLHAASAIRNKRAFVFTGVSGAGKTTISRLAPADVTLLTDEVSCIRSGPGGFTAWGTPFTGELGIPGDNISASVAALYFIEHGLQNRLSPLPHSEALRRLMRNILFFAEDAELSHRIFGAAAAFLAATPCYRLEFRPDSSVWDFIA